MKIETDEQLSRIPLKEIEKGRKKRKEGRKISYSLADRPGSSCQANNAGPGGTA